MAVISEVLRKATLEKRTEKVRQKRKRWEAENSEQIAVLMNTLSRFEIVDEIDNPPVRNISDKRLNTTYVFETKEEGIWEVRRCLPKKGFPNPSLIKAKDYSLLIDTLISEQVLRVHLGKDEEAHAKAIYFFMANWQEMETILYPKIQHKGRDSVCFIETKLKKKNGNQNNGNRGIDFIDGASDFIGLNDLVSVIEFSRHRAFEQARAYAAGFKKTFESFDDELYSFVEELKVVPFSVHYELVSEEDVLKHDSEVVLTPRNKLTIESPNFPAFIETKKHLR